MKWVSRGGVESALGKWRSRNVHIQAHPHPPAHSPGDGCHNNTTIPWFLGDSKSLSVVFVLL